jgi:hypothetical protein
VLPENPGPEGRRQAHGSPVLPPAPEEPPGPERASRSRRSLKWLSLAACCAVIAALAITRLRPAIDVDTPRSGMQRFSAHGLAFAYPSALRRLRPDEVSRIEWTPVPEGWADPADGPWGEFFALDDGNFVQLFPDPLPLVVTNANVEDHAASIRLSLKDGGVSVPPIRTFSLDGLPAIQVKNIVRMPSGDSVQKDLTEVFSGSIGYGISCQSTAGRREEMGAACTQILDSMNVPREDSISGWHVLRSGDGGVEISVPPLWDESPRHPRAVDLAAIMRFPKVREPLAVLVVGDQQLPTSVSTRTFASVIAKTSGMRVKERDTMRLSGRHAEVVALAARSRIIVSFVVKVRQKGYFVTFTVGSASDDHLVRPTMEAIAQTLSFH